jgi:hypothetical protein
MSGDYKCKQYRGFIHYRGLVQEVQRDELGTITFVLEYQDRLYKKNAIVHYYHAYIESDDTALVKEIIQCKFDKLEVVRIGYGNHPKYGKIAVFKLIRGLDD